MIDYDILSTLLWYTTKLYYTLLCYDILCYTILNSIKLFTMLNCTLLCYTILCYIMLYSAKLYCTIIYIILYYAQLWYVILVLIEPHTGYDAGLPCDRVPQCDFWDSTGYTFQGGDERQQGWWWMIRWMGDTESISYICIHSYTLLLCCML